MKIHKRIVARFVGIALAACALALPNIAHAAFVSFASFYRGDQEILQLEYEVRSDEWGLRVRWRITNHSNRNLYDVAVENKEYTLGGGTTVDRSGEMCKSGTLESGSTCTTLWDTVSIQKGTSLTRVEMRNPVIYFYTERNGQRYGASKEFSMRQ